MEQRFQPKLADECSIEPLFEDSPALLSAMFGTELSRGTSFRSDRFSIPKPKMEDTMNTKFLTVTALVATMALPIGAHAQNGVAAGATTGAVTGAVVGGPVGAAVGAGVGAVAGGIADDSRPRFRSYVSERNVPSYRYEHDVRVGADLPSSGVTYYDVPKEYGVTKYRYTVVNDRTVLVDPGTHRIVQVIE
jgi:hypothetical protein